MDDKKFAANVRTLRSVERSKGKPISVDPTAEIRKIEQEQKEKGVKYRCACCGKEYTTQKKNFPVSKSILFDGNNGFLPYCCSCVIQYYTQMVGFYAGNEEHALEHCCRIFDWYYSDAIAAMAKESTTGGSRIMAYSARMMMAQNASKGKTYQDTIRQRYAVPSVKETVAQTDLTDESADDADKVPLQSAIELFGQGYTAEEYKFLWREYQDWSTRYECKTKAQEELYKSLCLAQLTIQRASLTGSSRSVADSMKAFQDLLGSANLKPSQNSDDAFTDQQTFGTLIKKWETELPIAEPAPEWEDVDGIQHDIDVYMLGHLANLLHVENDKQAEYLAEIGKYTVKPPVYEEDETSETSLLDKYSTKGGGAPHDDAGDGDEDG